MKVFLDKLMKELELGESTGMAQLLKSILTTRLEFSVANHTFFSTCFTGYSYTVNILTGVQLDML